MPSIRISSTSPAIPPGYGNLSGFGYPHSWNLFTIAFAHLPLLPVVISLLPRQAIFCKYGSFACTAARIVGESWDKRLRNRRLSSSEMSTSGRLRKRRPRHVAYLPPSPYSTSIHFTNAYFFEKSGDSVINVRSSCQRFLSHWMFGAWPSQISKMQLPQRYVSKSESYLKSDGAEGHAVVRPHAGQ